MSDRGASARPDLWLLAFAAAVFVLHQLPAFAGAPAGDAIDLLTPFAVAAASSGLLAALGAPRTAVIVGLVAGVLYVHGVGIHLAANSIHNEGPTGGVEEITYFWDERFSHVEALLGWYGLVLAFCIAERSVAAIDARRGVLVAATALLGWAFFVSSVEGQTWPGQLVATAVAVAFALRARRDGSAPSRPLLLAATAAFVLATLLLGVWAAINGGVPEFSDAGII